MKSFINISAYNLDFIDYFKNKFNYYYTDVYPLTSYHYAHTFKILKKFLENIQNGYEVDKSIIYLIKLKLLIKKPKEIPWDFPIALHNNQISCGTGRILIDKFVFNNENKHTIISCNADTILPFKQFNSLKDLCACIGTDDLRIHIKDGRIAVIGNHSNNFGDDVLQYVTKYKYDYIEEIKNFQLSDENIIQFLNNDNLPF